MKNHILFLTSLLFFTSMLMTAEESGHDPHCTSCGENHNPAPTPSTNRLALKPSLVIDLFGYYQDSGSGAVHLTELSGFGHGPEESDHDHTAAENGLNLRHIELSFSGPLNPMIHGRFTVAFEAESIELEEAFVKAHGLRDDLDLTAGKFFSNFGLQNAQHSHAWRFWNRPLVYEAIFGEHGLNEVGLRLDWRSHSSLFSAGIEALQGENSLSFAKVEDDSLPEKNGPRLWVVWLATDIDIDTDHDLRFKLSGASGHHQEAHDEDGDDTLDHWFHGRTTLLSAGLQYTHAGRGENGKGMVEVRSEYVYRRKFLELKEHLLSPGEIGNNLESEQDGYYLQALYGIAPKWRVGLRWDEAGIRNITHLPDGSTERFGPSRRLSGMIDKRIGNASLVRFQIGQGDYELEDGDEKNWEFIVQWQIMFGGH